MSPQEGFALACAAGLLAGLAWLALRALAAAAGDDHVGEG